MSDEGKEPGVAADDEPTERVEVASEDDPEERTIELSPKQAAEVHEVHVGGGADQASAYVAPRALPRERIGVVEVDRVRIADAVNPRRAPTMPRINVDAAASIEVDVDLAAGQRPSAPSPPVASSRPSAPAHASPVAAPPSTPSPSSSSSPHQTLPATSEARARAAAMEAQAALRAAHVAAPATSADVASPAVDRSPGARFYFVAGFASALVVAAGVFLVRFFPHDAPSQPPSSSASAANASAPQPPPPVSATAATLVSAEATDTTASAASPSATAPTRYRPKPRAPKAPSDIHF